MLSRAFPFFFVVCSLVFVAVACGSSEGVNPSGSASPDASNAFNGNGTDATAGNRDGSSSQNDSSAASVVDGSPGPGTGGEGGSTSPTSTRTVDSRPYEVVVPSSYSSATPMPMLLLLHGYAENADDIDAYFGMSAYANTKGFLLAKPNGNKDSFGLQFWYADDACCDLDGTHPNDSGYLHDVIVDMKSAYNVDTKRVYVAGHSNGGFMSHRMACDHADEIAAIVSLAGAVWNDPSKCVPSTSISVLEVHGDADTVILYNGGVDVDANAYPSAPTTIATWAAKNGCDATLTATGQTLDLDSSLPGAETAVSSHACTNGAAELWTIHGGAHIPTFQPTWAATMYGFLDAHPKP